jgi:hypothetical protein
LESPKRFGPVSNSYCISIGSLTQCNIIINARPITSVNILNLLPFDNENITHFSPRSMEFLPEPFPKPRIIKPYRDHQHTEYKTSTVHGYSSFLMLIL